MRWIGLRKPHLRLRLHTSHTRRTRPKRSARDRSRPAAASPHDAGSGGSAGARPCRPGSHDRPIRHWFGKKLGQGYGRRDPSIELFLARDPGRTAELLSKQAIGAGELRTADQTGVRQLDPERAEALNHAREQLRIGIDALAHFKSSSGVNRRRSLTLDRRPIVTPVMLRLGLSR